MKLTVFLAVCWFSYAEVQNGTTENLEIIETSSSKLFLSESSEVTLTPKCRCVPYYLCTEEEETIDLHRDEESEMCDYLQRCCVIANTTFNSAFPELNQKQVRCGKSHKKENLTNLKNNETVMGEFPWMVAVLRIEKNETSNIETNHCGASLIHPQVVLTAAHCVYNKNYTYKIRAGEWDIRTTTELVPHEDRAVKDTVIHPKYHNGALFYDIALLILESPLELTDSVDVVCLKTQNTVLDNTLCYATGWGKEVYTAEEPNTPILKKIGLPIVDRDTCLDRLRKTRLGSYFKLHESFICAGGEVGKDTCKGDGGGPLVCPIRGKQDKFYQVGIVSWGINCGKDVPGVYGDVSKATEWIDDIMLSYKFDIHTYQDYD